MNRGIDKLGRIVIPKEIRKKLNITKNTNLNIEVKNDKIILTKDTNIDYKQALNEIREYIYKNSIPLGLVQKIEEQRLDFEGDINDILQIIDKVLGDDKR